MTTRQSELMEMSATLNSTTGHNEGNESYAKAIESIFIDAGGSFLSMLRRGRIYNDQVPYMVRIVEEDIEIMMAAEIEMPPSLATLASYTPGIRKVLLTALIQSVVDSSNSEMALTGITGGAVPFMQNLAKKTGRAAKKLIGGGD